MKRTRLLFFAFSLSLAAIGTERGPHQAGLCPLPHSYLVPREALPHPSPIPEHRREIEYPSAFRSHGKVFRTGEKFSKEDLKDGHYVYLVIRSENETVVVWGNRAPGYEKTDPDKNLVTHTSLLNRASETLGVPANLLTVLAAGEVQRLNGKTSRLNNRSGTRRGTSEHLLFAEMFLGQRGLTCELSPTISTERTDFSTTDPDESLHKEAWEMAELRAEVDKSPALVESRKKLIALHRKIYDIYPELRHPTIPGFLDTARIFSAALYDPKNALAPNVRFDISMYKDAMRWLQTEGADLATMNFRDIPYEKLESTLYLAIEGHHKHQGLSGTLRR